MRHSNHACIFNCAPPPGPGGDAPSIMHPPLGRALWFVCRAFLAMFHYCLPFSPFVFSWGSLRDVLSGGFTHKTTSGGSEPTTFQLANTCLSIRLRRFVALLNNSVPPYLLCTPPSGPEKRRSLIYLGGGVWVKWSGPGRYSQVRKKRGKQMWYMV